jgi:hypothetical protein
MSMTNDLGHQPCTNPHNTDVVLAIASDINPIGCISGKCYILRASNYEEVSCSIALKAKKLVEKSR